jgi:MFS transporter, CP family, cyanate transporter
MSTPAGALAPQPPQRDRAHDGHAGAALVTAVVLLSINLRSVLAGLPPVIADVRADLGLSAAAAGVLTTLPVLCMGAFAPVAPRIAGRVPMERALVACALLTAAGTGIRALGSTGSLFAAGMAIGVAIALAQALLPVLIRTRYHAASGVLTGAFSMALVLGSVLAAGLAVPLARLLGGWEWSLAFWALPALLAALVWLPAALRPGTTVARGGGAPLRRSALAWAVSGFFGIQSMAFYASLSWIPSILEDGGWSSEAAGGLLAFGALCGLVPAFLVPVIAARSRDQLRLLLAIVLLPSAGLAGVLVVPDLAPLWMVLIGFGQSGALGLALALPLQRGGDAPTVASLTAMALCVGYLVAAAGPWLLGAVHDASGDWTVPLVVLIAITLAELIPGLPAARPRTIARGES